MKTSERIMKNSKDTILSLILEMSGIFVQLLRLKIELKMTITSITTII